jgi:hypothetical protein
MSLHEVESKYGREPFQPHLKPGQMPGQETLHVSAWSVDDVARWLQVRGGTAWRGGLPMGPCG